MTDTHAVSCPYCGERLVVAIDRSVRRQEYIEDCQVCCRPNVLTVTLDGSDSLDQDANGDVSVEARSEDA